MGAGDTESHRNLGARALSFAHSRAAANVIAAVSLFVLSVGMFGDLLVLPGDRVVSDPALDIANYFAPSRRFASEEILRGNTPLWNPYSHSGSPYQANFQSALFYPPNLLFYLILPLPKALNADVAFHVFLIGIFMFFWARGRGLSAPAALFAGALVMFCQSHFLRVVAGHLTLLCARAWLPLLLFSVDRIFDRPRLSWALLGVFATTMMILAGLPQTVFCSAIAVGAYCALNLWRVREKRGRVAALLAVVAVVPLLTGAIQLWPGLAAAQESTRNDGLTFEYAARYSFPPENLIMFLVPGFFGDYCRMPYWGRQFNLWEVGCFIGVTGLFLACWGTLFGNRSTRRHCATIACLLALLAVGHYFFLFRFLYDILPGFDKFRAPGRFMFYAVLFVAMLSGYGADVLLQGSRDTRRVAWAMSCLAACLAVMTVWIDWSASAPGHSGAWDVLFDAMKRSDETEWPLEGISCRDAALFAARGCRIACATTFCLAALLWFSRTRRLSAEGKVRVLRGRSPWAAHAILALGVAEVFFFALNRRASFDLGDFADNDIRAFLDTHPGDYRVVDCELGSNRVLDLHAYGIWGYCPFLLIRYSRFLCVMEGEDRVAIGGGDSPMLNRYHPILAMLRCAYALPPRGDSLGVRRLRVPPLPHCLLVSRYRIIPDAESLLDAMLTDPAFNPYREVLLESPPQPEPDPNGRPGRVALISNDTDRLVIEAETPDPAILVITDVYARGWRARPLQDGPQFEYTIMPGNYILRAIPLTAGKHLLEVEYAPAAFSLGAAATVISVAVCVVVACFSIIGKKRPRKS